MIMSNSLAAMRPELVREWSDKNLPLTPDKITYGSNKIVWWKAACGHEWQTSVKARSKGENCPICSGAILAVRPFCICWTVYILFKIPPLDIRLYFY